MGLPNWNLYYYAAALNWLKDWIISKNQRVINLERHNLQFGWHALLIYGKARQEGWFKNHLIRRALLWMWEQIRFKVYQKSPSVGETLGGGNKPRMDRKR